MKVYICYITVLPIECTTSNEDDIEYKTEYKRFSIWYVKKCSDNSYVSPLHDVPLNTGKKGVFRAVIVMPRLNPEKNRIITVMNPIVNNYIVENTLV